MFDNSMSVDFGILGTVVEVSLANEHRVNVFEIKGTILEQAQQIMQIATSNNVGEINVESSGFGIAIYDVLHQDYKGRGFLKDVDINEFSYVRQIK